jgi:hypothetical protein
MAYLDLMPRTGADGVPRDSLPNKLPVLAPAHERLFQHPKQVSGCGCIVTLLGQASYKAGLVSDTLLAFGNVPIR